MFEQIGGLPQQREGDRTGAEQLPYAALETNPREFGLFLATYRDDVVHFLYRMLQDRATAEDLSIEAFARVCSAPFTVSNPAECLATRLFRIAAELAFERATTEPPREKYAKFAHVAPALVSMAPRQRAALLLHKFHQMDFMQIANVLNCTEIVAKRLILSGYQSVRERFAECKAPL